MTRSKRVYVVRPNDSPLTKVWSMMMGNSVPQKNHEIAHSVEEQMAAQSSQTEFLDISAEKEAWLIERQSLISERDNYHRMWMEEKARREDIEREHLNVIDVDTILPLQTKILPELQVMLLREETRRHAAEAQLQKARSIWNSEEEQLKALLGSANAARAVADERMTRMFQDREETLQQLKQSHMREVQLAQAAAALQITARRLRQTTGGKAQNDASPLHILPELMLFGGTPLRGTSQLEGEDVEEVEEEEVEDGASGVEEVVQSSKTQRLLKDHPLLTPEAAL